jgi:hypothetical protein
MHTTKNNPCSEARLLMNFYFSCKGSGKHALDLAARGSFKLLPPSEASQVMVNLFVTYNEQKRILKDLKTTMDTSKKKVDMCTSKLPNRQNMEFLEDFAIEKLGVVENNIVAMVDNLNLFESSL